MPREEKSKFELEEKKFSLLLKVELLCHKLKEISIFSNKVNCFFSRVQVRTQSDHIRLLYKFESEQKNFGCVESCGYAPASVKKSLLPETCIALILGADFVIKVST